MEKKSFHRLFLVLVFLTLKDKYNGITFINWVINNSTITIYPGIQFKYEQSICHFLILISTLSNLC